MQGSNVRTFIVLPRPILDLVLLGALPCVCVCGLVQVSIHVITNDRLPSLRRLVSSMVASHFLGDEVELSFHIDVDADTELMDYLMVRLSARTNLVCTLGCHGP